MMSLNGSGNWQYNWNDNGVKTWMHRRCERMHCLHLGKYRVNGVGKSQLSFEIQRDGNKIQSWKRSFWVFFAAKTMKDTRKTLTSMEIIQKLNTKQEKSNHSKDYSTQEYK